MGDLDWIEIVYLICFFLGLGFAIISGLLSGVFSGAEGAGDMGGDVGGDFGGDAGGDVAGHEVAFSPLSPVVLAMFIASFGGAGIILKMVMGWPLFAHVPVAAVSGFVIAGITFYVFYKVFQLTQGSSHSRAVDAIGLEAQVTVPIPNNGLGQIAYTQKGMRFTNQAQSSDGKELPVGLAVRIVKRVGNTFIVEKTK